MPKFGQSPFTLKFFPSSLHARNSSLITGCISSQRTVRAAAAILPFSACSRKESFKIAIAIHWHWNDFPLIITFIWKKLLLVQMPGLFLFILSHLMNVAVSLKSNSLCNHVWLGDRAAPLVCQILQSLHFCVPYMFDIPSTTHLLDCFAVWFFTNPMTNHSLNNPNLHETTYTYEKLASHLSCSINGRWCVLVQYVHLCGNDLYCIRSTLLVRKMYIKY